MLLVVLALPGCYYTHLAAGQARLLWGRKPVAELISDPDTPVDLKRRLELVARARTFASELGLEMGDQYTSYVAWPGDRVLTTVVATRPGEVEAAGFSFPIVGRVPYKGFFDPARAEALATRLREQGLDVCLVAVDAYSTLGWLDDPLTEPMLLRSDGELVETVLHELVHASVFVGSQPDFNEGVANFIGEEGAVRFFAAHGPEIGDADAGVRERERIREDRLVASTLGELRQQVAELYAEDPPPDDLAERREALERLARERVAALPLETRDPEELALHLRLNDACLALRGTYTRDTRRHVALLARHGGDLAALVARLRAAADAADPREAFLGDADLPVDAGR